MSRNIARNRRVYDWNVVPWRKLEKATFKLQKRIYRAAIEGNKRKARRLQGLLTRSWSAKMIAVRQVTQQNKGKKTAGIDGATALRPTLRQPLVKQLILDRKVKASPTRRVWIPKPSRTEKRPLGIPTIYDRALQGLVKMALEPEWEATFEPNSYGFRPGRGGHDATEAIFRSISRKSKWILDADIAKFFDGINHEALLKKLNNSSPIRRQIRAWLKAGVMDKGVYQNTNTGTPQGGVISPLLANIALHGLEEAVMELIPTKKKKEGLTVVRYADDFVVIHEDIEVIKRAKRVVEQKLSTLGIELKKEKTRITHTLEGEEPGFDFLGFNIRQYEISKYHSGKTGKGFKTLIKPSTKAIKEHKKKIATTIKSHRAAPPAALIAKLNPIIRGWSNYYRTVVSKETYNSMDAYLWETLWQWAKRRHTQKSHQWIIKKYWGTKGLNNWVFKGKTKNGEEISLTKHSETEIVRHVKVKGTASPFNGDTVYWSKRLRKSSDVSRRVLKLLDRQEGKCARCGLVFRSGDQWEVDHVLPKSLGGKDWYTNLQLLHDYCHDAKSAEDGSNGKRSVRLNLDGEIEEPDEVKVSRPVLKTSRRGDPLA
ncbi:MAG: group II intron reverse transcriptase/maturase [Hormoscilla sp. GUM202]|nr:group II intron reverse transcriptase/maturase [Hormoscilla sp. GUM202]